VSLLRFAPYVVKTCARARTRTALTVAGTALALAIFAFVRTLEAGVDSLDASAQRPVLVVFQQSRFCPLTSELPLRYRGTIEKMPGVEAVLPTLVFVNKCQANLDLVTFHGVDPATLELVDGVRAVAGDLATWKGARDSALVGRRLAERRHLKVGDPIRVSNLGLDVRVGAIVDGDGPGLDNVAFVHREPLELARAMAGSTSMFLVRLGPGADAVATAAAIDAAFASEQAPTDTKSLQAFVQGAVGEVSGLLRFARLLGWLAVAVVVLVLGNTVFISAQTRAAELGTLETVGLPKAGLACLVAAESLLLALVGGSLGTAAVVLAFAAHPTTLGIEGYGIDFVAGWPVLLSGFLASAAVGAIAAVGPAVEALRRPLAAAVKPA
jgi:putative ABC transport system permease protein